MKRIGSLCTGYGGLDLAVSELFNAETVWLSEFDKHAATVCDVRFPGIPNLGDLTTVDWAAVEPVDILTAGYPCQPFSHAGNRKGTADDRHIWPHIANAIRVLRPRLVVLENVAGHVSLGLDTVLSDLASLGFDAEWGTVRASDIGAPHRRERLFIVATDAENDGRERSGVAWSGWAGLADNGQPTTDTDSTGLERRGILPERADQRAAGSHSMGIGWGDYAPAIRRWESSIGRAAPNPTTLGRTGRPVLNPQFVEWMMGLPAGWVTDLDIPRGQQLKILGNGVVPQQAEAAIVGLYARACIPHRPSQRSRPRARMSYHTFINIMIVAYVLFLVGILSWLVWDIILWRRMVKRWEKRFGYNWVRPDSRRSKRLRQEFESDPRNANRPVMCGICFDGLCESDTSRCKFPDSCNCDKCGTTTSTQ